MAAGKNIRRLTWTVVLCLLAGAHAQGPGPAPATSTAPNVAPAPAPVDPCTVTQLVGPGPYAASGKADALLQGPRTTYICPQGLLGVSSFHASVPNYFFPGPAKSSNTQWNAVALIMLCKDGSTLNPESTPMSDQYTNALPLDLVEAYGFTPPTAAATYYNVSATSNYFLHNVIGSNLDAPSSEFYIPDTAISRVVCPANQSFIGARVSQSYGGIDYLEFVCAPNCYNLNAGQTIKVGVNTVTVGQAFAESATAPAPSTQTCPSSYIGPGQTVQAAVPDIVQPPPVRSVCPGNSFITQWDVRGYPWPLSWTGEKVAYIGAKCSDGSFLAPVPAGALLTRNSYGQLGADIYYTAGGLSGVNDAAGWNSIPVGLDSPAAPFGLGLFLGSAGVAGRKAQPADGDEVYAVKCGAGQRAIGYLSAGYTGGGIALIDLICTQDCSATANAPSPAGSRPTQPSDQSSAAQQLYGCGSTIQAHIGPGSYGMLRNAAPQQGSYYTSVCPAGSYIVEWRVGVSSYDARLESSEYDTVITHVQGRCAADTTGTPGGASLATVVASKATNETEYIFQSQNGFGTFEISPGTELQLVQFLGVDDNPAANYTLKCPDSYKAVGYIASPYAYGIDFFDIICGPGLPDDCPQTIGGGSGGQCPPGNTQTSGNPSGTGSGAGAGSQPPFVYTTNPTGPSWQGGSTGGAARPPPPPPKKSAGNTINRADLTASDVYLQAVISATGNVDPFTTALQNAFNSTIAKVTGIPGKNVKFITSRLQASSGRRHLLAELGRHLLAQGTQLTTWSINAGSADCVAATAENLAASFANGTFASTLSTVAPGVTAGLVSMSASDTQAETQASSTCNKKFGSICIQNSRLSKGGIAGIIIGGCVFIILVVGIIAWVVSRRRRTAL